MSHQSLILPVGQSFDCVQLRGNIHPLVYNDTYFSSRRLAQHFIQFGIDGVQRRKGQRLSTPEFHFRTQ